MGATSKQSDGIVVSRLDRSEPLGSVAPHCDVAQLAGHRLAPPHANQAELGQIEAAIVTTVLIDLELLAVRKRSPVSSPNFLNLGSPPTLAKNLLHASSSRLSTCCFGWVGALCEPRRFWRVATRR